MMVGAVALKMKDPKRIIRDMEKLDETGFNPVQQPQLSEKVLKDKLKKLRETFEQILRLYEKENPDIYKELRELEVAYEQKRTQLSQCSDAVKNAQHVSLPDTPQAPSNILIQNIPGAQPPSILKKTQHLGLQHEQFRSFLSWDMAFHVCPLNLLLQDPHQGYLLLHLFVLA